MLSIVLVTVLRNGASADTLSTLARRERLFGPNPGLQGPLAFG
jgi:hypothetical protein